MQRFRDLSVRWLCAPLLLASAYGCAPAPVSAPEPTRSELASAPYIDLYPPNDSRRHGDLKIRTDEKGVPISSKASPVGGYGPADLQAAYGLPSSGGPGAGKIVAIFGGDSDYVNAESDLAVYRSQFGLPPCTTANGCFQKIDDKGGTNYPAATDNAVEQALDLQMASAGCPSCKIVLIEGSDLGAMLQTLIAKGAAAFSFSILYGYGAEGTASVCRSTGFDAPHGLVVTAGLGDTGYPGTTDWFPVACQASLAIGGTTLKKDSSARGWSETAWSGTGSGCTGAVTKPAWQNDTGCAQRVVGDLSAVADPGTGMAVYSTTGAGGWLIVGGTSAAGPLVAGALTATGIANGRFSPSWVWGHTGDFYDVTSGSDGDCPGYICHAGQGFDGPTGWGTPNGKALAAATPASCEPPTGSYAQSCDACWVSTENGKCVLTCKSCGKIDGTSSTNPSVGLPCHAGISNDDGVLHCLAPEPAPDDGGAPAADDGGDPSGGAPDGGADAATGSTGQGGDDAGSTGPGPVGGGGAEPSQPSGGCSVATGHAQAFPLGLLLLGLCLVGLRRRARA